MIKINRGWTTPLLLLLSVLCCLPATAQDTAQNETVLSRARPELDALGVRMGAFNLFPVLAVGATHNDNIYADDLDIISDRIFVLSPGLTLASNWNNHSLEFGADADIMRYNEITAEDHENYAGWIEGRLDVGRLTFLSGEYSHRRRHEDRGAPDDVRGFEPTAFDEDRLAIAYEARLGPRRFHTRLAADVEELDYHDVEGSAGIINNDDRDRRRVTGTARIGYGFHPAYSIFLQGSAHSVDYDSQFDDRGFERSSTGYEVALGTVLDFSGETFGELFVGYLSEEYDDQRFDSIDGVSFGAELSWNVSGLTTLGISGRREVEPTTTAETAGRDVVRFGLGVDHELLRNLILSLDWTTATEDFHGIEREDDVDSVEFEARYMMNRRLVLSFGYRYRQRDTSPLEAGGTEFSRNIFNLTLQGQL